jgi:hypothetical protein
MYKKRAVLFSPTMKNVHMSTHFPVLIDRNTARIQQEKYLLSS